MARLPRLNLPGIPQHIIQRGNNRQACFGAEQDFAAYAHWLKEASEKYQVAIHAWVFMTNHVHLLVTPEKERSVSQMMQYLGRHYVQYFNHQYRRSGTLWEGRYKSCLVEDDTYLLDCYRYIELNPVRANMVNGPGDYVWSSYGSNALGRQTALCTPHPLYLELGASPDERLLAYRGLFAAHIDEQSLITIRKATNAGMVLGSELFKDQIEKQARRRVRPKRAGRPSKQVGGRGEVQEILL